MSFYQAGDIVKYLKKSKKTLYLAYSGDLAILQYTVTNGDGHWWAIHIKSQKGMCLHQSEFVLHKRPTSVDVSAASQQSTQNLAANKQQKGFHMEIFAILKHSYGAKDHIARVKKFTGAISTVELGTSFNSILKKETLNFRVQNGAQIKGNFWTLDSIRSLDDVSRHPFHDTTFVDTENPHTFPKKERKPRKDKGLKRTEPETITVSEAPKIPTPKDGGPSIAEREAEQLRSARLRPVINDDMEVGKSILPKSK